MSQRHLTIGSTEPPLEKGVLRLYGMRFCPYVYRARLVLAAKNIKYELVNINLKNKPEWYLAKHPLGKVPLLEWDGYQIVESLIIADYLDEKYPDNPLWSKDPYERACGRILLETVDRAIEYMYKIRNGDQSAYDGLRIELKDLEKHLKKPYFSGNKPGMVDYMSWPFFEMLIVVWESPLYKGTKELFPEGELTLLASWVERMQKDPIVKKCTPGKDLLIRFIVSMSEGNPNYDLGL